MALEKEVKKNWEERNRDAVNREVMYHPLRALVRGTFEPGYMIRMVYALPFTSEETKKIRNKMVAVSIAGEALKLGLGYVIVSHFVR